VRTISCGQRVFTLGAKTHVVGIVNCTPEFDAGADMLDIGGESTRPDADVVEVNEEIDRVLPIVEKLISLGLDSLSVDTRNAKTARAAHCAGVSWLNDVSAFEHDEQMLDVARHFEGVVLMHARGTPKTMQKGNISYNDVVDDVRLYLEKRLALFESAGGDRHRVLLDPGIGFGKTLAHNLALSVSLDSFRAAAGVYYGASRKSFLGELTGIRAPKDRDAASLATTVAAFEQGADFVRVHDVSGTVAALKVSSALQKASCTRNNHS